MTDLGEKNFLSLKGAYAEHREVHPKSAFSSNVKPELGEEYILSYQRGTWWWTEGTIDHVMEYLKSWSM
jgi:hypothetical protein